MYILHKDPKSSEFIVQDEEQYPSALRAPEGALAAICRFRLQSTLLFSFPVICLLSLFGLPLFWTLPNTVE